MWFTGINYYKLAVEKDRDSIGSLRPYMETRFYCTVVGITSAWFPHYIGQFHEWVDRTCL